MDIEYIPRKRFSCRGTPKQERKLAIGACMFGKIIIYYEDVPPFFHEILSHGGCRIRSNEIQTRCIFTRCHDHDAILERIVFHKIGDHFCYGRALLPDCAIDAYHILLVYYRIKSNSGFPCLPVTQDKLALASSYTVSY